MATILHHNKRGKPVWSIRWKDATKGNGSDALRDARCVGGSHDEAFEAAGMSGSQRAALADGASNSTQREMLRKAYTALERLKLREAQLSKAVGGANFDLPATDFFDAVIGLWRYRVALGQGERAQPPQDLGWRPAAAERAYSRDGAKLAMRIVGEFAASLQHGTTTGQLTGDHIRIFLTTLRRDRGIAAATLNRYRSILLSAFRALTARARRRLFRTDPIEWFEDDAAPLPQAPVEVETCTPEQVAAFLSIAEQRANPERIVKVKRRRNGKLERFSQRQGPDPAPVFEWALLLACTGVRRSEAANLKWEDVDLKHGIIRVRATKTGAVRHIPLVGDPSGDIAPAFLDVLHHWRDQRPRDEYVLPANGSARTFPKHAWEACNTAAGVTVGPQGLRRTFESMLAMIGRPAGLAAFWLGHSVQVAERHYRAYAPGRLPGNTVESALGLTPFLVRIAGAEHQRGDLRTIA